MRAAKLVVILGVLLAPLLGVGTAKAATCGCVTFTHAFTHNAAGTQTAFFAAAKRDGIPVSGRLGVSKAIYDWDKRHDFKTKFCERHTKICRAAKACLIAAATTYTTARLNGVSYGPAARDAGIACAGAASATLAVA